MHAKALIENGKTDRIYGFLTKSKSQFSALLKLDGERVVFEESEFENQGLITPKTISNII